MDVEIETAVQPDVADLLHEGDVFMLGLYPPDACFLLSTEELAEEDVTLWVARDEDGVALGMVALVPYTDTGFESGTWELKRMFVRDRVRGQGVGAALLRSAERWATESGASRIVLETGPHNRAALRLYETHGFRSIPQYGQYVGGLYSTCFTKALG